MRNFLFAVSIAAVFSGCAWKNIPQTEAYNTTQNIPIVVGVTMNNKSSVYGTKIIEEMDGVKFFKKIIYPYRADDKVDAVMDLNISGKWIGSGAAAGFITGLTLGLAGTAVGPSLEGNHTVKANITTKNGIEVGKYEANAENKVMWGMAASTSEVSAAADALQVKTLTKKLMDTLYKDRDAIVNSVKKSN